MEFKAYFDKKPHDIKITEDKKGFLVTIDRQKPFHIDLAEKLIGSYSVIYKDKSFEFDVENKESQYFVLHRGRFYTLELINLKSALVKPREPSEKRLTSKMPGKITKILVKEGETVHKGTGLIIMEAMKMENELKAPAPSKIKKIKVKEGQNVEVGEELILFE